MSAPRFGGSSVLLRAAWSVALLVLPGASVWARPVDHKPSDGAELNRVVRDLCDRDVVLLGEDAGHGAGRTTEVKSLIIRRLITECGFGAVAFESQFYDFLNFERSVTAGKATRQDLADAIGALWSRTSELQPLVDFLFERVTARKVRVAGIDPQVGGITGFFSQRQLGAELATLLAEDRRGPCEAEMDRHHAWTYDDAHPFDAAARASLRTCGRALVAPGVEASSEKLAMAHAYARYLEATLDADVNARDLGMFENFSWHRAHWPKGTKTIVWCATSHAARAASPAIAWRPLGSYVAREFGGRVAVIGFSAASGTFAGPGGRGKTNPLAAPEPGALEAVGSAGLPDSVRYLDAKRLKEIGSVSGRALSYAKPQVLDWSALLDGIILLEERAASPMR